jgi:hypothetical protein
LLWSVFAAVVHNEGPSLSDWSYSLGKIETVIFWRRVERCCWLLD